MFEFDAASFSLSVARLDPHGGAHDHDGLIRTCNVPALFDRVPCALGFLVQAPIVPGRRNDCRLQPRPTCQFRLPLRAGIAIVALSFRNILLNSLLPRIAVFQSGDTLVYQVREG